LRRLWLLVLLHAAPAWGFSAGVFGLSGKPPERSCTECHAGGAAPRVALDGPLSLVAGSAGVYTFDVVTGASSRVAGFNVAVSAGALSALPQANASFLNNGEISHKLPLGKGQTVRVRFQLDAPAEPGTLTLFATGLSGDGSGTGGDGTAATTLTVTVTAPPDLAGVDLFGVDLATAPPDLAELDAMSGASPIEPLPDAPPDLGPPRDEAEWLCECRFGPSRPPGKLPLALALALLLVLLRRARRVS
jgi:hypothetical protein